MVKISLEMATHYVSVWLVKGKCVLFPNVEVKIWIIWGVPGGLTNKVVQMMVHQTVNKQAVTAANMNYE